MAAPTLCALLFVVGVLVMPVRMESDLCNTTNSTTTGVPFNLTVTADNYIANTNYNVTVTGVANFTGVRLQAVEPSKNGSLGTWSGTPGSSLCTDGSFVSNSSSTSLTVQWTSPSTSQSVEIWAYIKQGNTSYLIKKALAAVSSTAAPPSSNTSVSSNMSTPTSNQTVTSPSNGNSTSTTASNVTSATPTVTVIKPSTTKNGSEKSSYSSSILIAAFQVVCLLFANGRQTS